MNAHITTTTRIKDTAHLINSTAKKTTYELLLDYFLGKLSFTRNTHRGSNVMQKTRNLITPLYYRSDVLLLFDVAIIMYVCNVATVIRANCFPMMN